MAIYCHARDMHGVFERRKKKKKRHEEEKKVPKECQHWSGLSEYIMYKKSRQLQEARGDYHPHQPHGARYP